MIRLKTLQNLLKLIDKYSKNDKYFRELYSHLIAEISICESENLSEGMGTYLFDLKQTLQKQAKSYIAKEHLKTKKLRMIEYKDFIFNFRDDILSGITFYKN
jgi:hypothetical protein